MIIVTGTHRSGTSLWMQILMAAGFTHLGRAFPGEWQAIAEANPRGFYETLLRQGIYYQTNPHPHTGRFLHPAQTHALLVKVFIPGLIRSDYAYLDRVVATLRPWREYCHSFSWLVELESRAHQAPVAAPPRPRLPPEIAWWNENYALIKDICTRRYPCQVVSWRALFEDPAANIRRVLAFLGGGDLAAATAVVDPALYRHHEQPWPSEHLQPADVAVFDRLHDTVYHRQAIDGELLQAMAETDGRIRGRMPAWMVPASDALSSHRDPA